MDPLSTGEVPHPPWAALVACGLAALWVVMVWMQRSALVRKYEEETTLAETQAVRKAHLLLRFFGPGVRAGFYSMHLAFISSFPEGLVLRYPGYADVGRSYVHEHFSRSERLMARLSTLAGLASLAIVLVAG